MFKHIYSFIDKIKSKLSQKGQGMIEYALIIAFVAGIAAVLLNSNLKGAVQTAFGNATQALTNANGGDSSSSGGDQDSDQDGDG